MLTDPIADMFTRIKNAQMAKKGGPLLPYSKINFEIATLLQKKGFLKEVSKRGRGISRIIHILFGRDEADETKIKKLVRISKPSRRIYAGWRDLLKTRREAGHLLVSTSKGVMDDKEAIKAKLGGEVIGEVW